MFFVFGVLVDNERVFRRTSETNLNIYYIGNMDEGCVYIVTHINGHKMESPKKLKPLVDLASLAGCS